MLRRRCLSPDRPGGNEAEKPFLASRRQHIGFFVDYTLGRATGNEAMVARVKKDLHGFAHLSRAAHHMPMTAATLAGGNADNKRLDRPSTRGLVGGTCTAVKIPSPPSSQT